MNLFSVGVNFSIPHGLPLESMREEFQRALDVLLPQLTADAVIEKCKRSGVAGNEIDLRHNPLTDIYGDSWGERIAAPRFGKEER